MDGSDVASRFAQGRIKEISDYCQTDVMNTYRVWLRYELFRGRLAPEQFAASEVNLVAYVNERAETKPHLAEFLRGM